MSKQRSSIKARKRLNASRKSSGYTAGQLEALAAQLVEAGLSSELILTTPRHMYRDRKTNR